MVRIADKHRKGENMELGYLIEYSEKQGFIEPPGETQRAFVTQQRLSDLLQRKVSYIIWSARWINYSEYKINVGELPIL